LDHLLGAGHLLERIPVKALIHAEFFCDWWSQIRWGLVERRYLSVHVAHLRNAMAKRDKPTALTQTIVREIAADVTNCKVGICDSPFGVTKDKRHPQFSIYFWRLYVLQGNWNKIK
jgi:hypothetical protein